ncbi:MAG: hypothetical protein P4L49_19590 [Desulfosporosinus sp.]|nr:hypothetical protein [Desulfosporosinus sp.]
MNSSIPVQVSTLTDIVSISADAQGSEAFAFDSSGKVWAWGHFGSGFIGGGTSSPLTTDSQPIVPIQLSNLKNIVAIAYGGIGDKNKQSYGVSSAEQIWYALDSSGQIWGWDFIGNQAKDGIQITPDKVLNLSNIVAIAGRGADHRQDLETSGYALDSSGHVWAWGNGVNGELGNGTITDNQATPVQVSNLSNIVEIAGDGLHGFALDSSDRVWLWGIDTGGQTNGISNVPVQVLGLPK